MIDDALISVAKNIFPHRVLEIQKIWMRRAIRKPKDMPVRKLIVILTKMNNSLTRFLEADEDDKFGTYELLEIIESDHVRVCQSDHIIINNDTNHSGISQQSIRALRNRPTSNISYSRTSMFTISPINVSLSLVQPKWRLQQNSYNTGQWFTGLKYSNQIFQDEV
jgi:hypothetical protein